MDEIPPSLPDDEIAPISTNELSTPEEFSSSQAEPSEAEPAPPPEPVAPSEGK